VLGERRLMEASSQTQELMKKLQNRATLSLTESLDFLEILPEGGADTPIDLPWMQQAYDHLAFEDIADYYVPLTGGRQIRCAQDWEYYFLAGKGFFYQKKTNIALSLFRKLLKYQQNSGEFHLRGEIYLYLGWIYFQKNDFHETLKHLTQSMKFSRQYDEKKGIFKAYFLYMMVDSRHRLFTNVRGLEIYEELLNLAREIKEKNGMAYWLSRPDRLDYTTTAGQELINTHLKEAEKIARSYKNTLRLSAVYHNMAFASFSQQNRNITKKLYQKSEKLKLQVGDSQELAYIQNGIGFFFHQQGDFAKSSEYFLKAYNSAVQALDFQEGAMSLANIGLNLFFTFQTESARRYLQFTLKIMKILNLEYLSYHSRFELRTLLSTCAFLQNSPGEALSFQPDTSQLMDEKNYPNSHTEEFFQHYLNTIIHCFYNQEIHKGKKVLFELIEALENSLQGSGYRLPFLAILCQSGLLGENLDQEEKRRLWDKGAQKAEQQDLKFYREIFNNHRGTRYRSTVPPIDLTLLETTVRQEQTIVHLNKEVSNLDFYSSLEALVPRNRSASQLIEETLQLIDATYPVESLTLSTEVKGKWRIIGRIQKGFGSWHLHNDDKIIPLLLEKSSSTKVFSRNELKPDIECPAPYILHIPVLNRKSFKGHLLITYQEALYLSSKDMGAIAFAAKNLMEKLESLTSAKILDRRTRALEAANERLRILAERDTLTGLYNRATFLTKAAKERERHIRLMENHSDSLSIVFMDLDNFKYYNDTFGHHGGDIVIQEFCRLLKHNTRDFDILARFGGDEFLILLPHTKPEEAGYLSRRILKELKNAKGFAPLLSKNFQRKITIPRKNWLGVSIGIAYDDVEKRASIEDLVRQADSALYQAKERGKNQFSLGETT